MKRQLFFMLLLTIVLTSCTLYNSPKLNDPKSPFIVERIEYYNSEFDTYCGIKGVGTYSRTLVLTPRIVLPKNSYNIGDTIIFKK